MLADLWTPYAFLLLAPTLAVAAFMVIGLDPFYLSRRQVQALALAGGIAPLAVMLPFGLSCIAGPCTGTVPIFTLTVGDAVVALALELDPLSALFGVTVTTIGACVIAYSVPYMADVGTADLRRYFALMNLFLAAMLTMVLAGDSIVFFLGWEMMGLCSFFLIAYNTGSASAINAGRKAFIMTRLADAFLLAALLLLFLEAGSVRLDALIPAGMAMDDSRRTVIAWLLLGGALGKSAQVPFHTWLPSAMAGPTPVSALLHSATMVAAGAFLMMRFAPLMQEVPSVQAVAAVLGAVTALFAALSALFQQDVKRLLAYSSISQIGFMMLSLGAGAPAAAAAHFVIHAVFKSLLFLSAGDITHGSARGTDMAAMRGAWRRRPAAYAAFAAGAASLAGLPVVTAGWWSKEAILASVHHAAPMGTLLWAVALLAAVLTGAYALRPVLIGLMAPLPAPAETHAEPAHDDRLGSPFTFVPLAFLAVSSLVGGILVSPIIRFLGAAPPHASWEELALAALAPFAGAAIALAIAFVPALSDAIVHLRRTRHRARRGRGGASPPPGGFLRLARLFSQGARVDDLYRIVFVWPFVHLVRWLSGYRGTVADPVGTLPVRVATGAMRAIVAPLSPDWLDRVWMRFAAGVVSLWGGARRLQSGRTRDYALAMAAGTLALLLLAGGQ
jgi:NADH-quinone oxidoreductase subunit L